MFLPILLDDYKPILFFYISHDVLQHDFITAFLIKNGKNF